MEKSQVSFEGLKILLISHFAINPLVSNIWCSMLDLLSYLNFKLTFWDLVSVIFTTSGSSLLDVSYLFDEA